MEKGIIILKKVLFAIGFLTMFVSFLYSSNEVSANVDEETMCVLENEEEMSKVLEENYAYYEKLMQYVIFENNQYSFDRNSAVNDGLSDFDIESGESLIYFKNEEIHNGDKSAFEEAKKADSGMIEPYAWHRYGNYCGLGNSGGTPVNSVDRTCMVHDNCYDQDGWGNCDCDRALMYSMTAHASNSNLSAGQRTFAGGAAAHFASRVTLGLCSS